MFAILSKQNVNFKVGRTQRPLPDVFKDNARAGAISVSCQDSKEILHSNVLELQRALELVSTVASIQNSLLEKVEKSALFSFAPPYLIIR